MCFLAMAAGLQAAVASEQTDTQNELKFASELVRWRFPDYAQKVVDRLLYKYPGAKAEAAKVRVEVLTSRGKFEDAEALLKSMPPGQPETMVVQLAIGDQYYAWGRMKDAQRVYEAFFKQFPAGPPAAVARLFGESAYKFSQMLLLAGDLQGSLVAYRRVLTCPLNSPEVERRVKTEMAELCVRVAELKDTTPAAKKAVLAEAEKLCNEVQWKGQDLWFAKTLTVMAHIRLVNGDKAGARKVILDYMQILSDVDKMLRENKEPLKLSPMAECKFLLGSLYEEDGKKLVEADKKAGIKMLADALTQFYSVVKNYPGSNWAPEARRRGDSLVETLQKMNLKVTIGEFDNSLVVMEQLKEAKTTFQNQDFKSAVEKYTDVLNIADDFAGAPRAASELARCYIQLDDDPYARAMTSYLAERFSKGSNPQVTNQYEEAGGALLAVASLYEERRALMKADTVYDLYYRYYPAHSKVPAILFRQGESAMRVTNYVDALKNYQRVTESYTNSRTYPDALSRQAYCLSMLEDHTNAIPLLQAYMALLSPGIEQLNARLRLADENRLTGLTVPALNEYARLIKLIDQTQASLANSQDDLVRVRRTKELALYNKAQCYSRLREPAAQVPLYQAKAIEGYELFLKEFPKSDMAPSALATMGTLYSMLNKPEEATKAFGRLSKEYPDSQQAKNAVFAQADALMSMGEKDRAVKVYAEMFKNTAAFTAPQFLRAGKVLLDAKEYETAKLAYAEARKSKEPAIVQTAMVGLGQSLNGAGNFEEAVKVFEEFLNAYPKSYLIVEVNLSLSRSYAEQGKKASDAAKAKPLFDKAYAAMGKVRQYSGKDPEMSMKASIEMAGIQVLKNDKPGAAATYLGILLCYDPSAIKTRPLVEKAFEGSLPVFREAGSWADMLEVCETYMKNFPQGVYLAKARQGRDEAKAKLTAGQ